MKRKAKPAPKTNSPALNAKIGDYTRRLNKWHEAVKEQLHAVEALRGPPFADHLIEGVYADDVIAVVLNIIYADKAVRDRVAAKTEDQNVQSERDAYNKAIDT